MIDLIDDSKFKPQVNKQVKEFFDDLPKIYMITEDESLKLKTQHSNFLTIKSFYM